MAGLLLVLGLVFYPILAFAQGPACSASVNGVPVAGQTITVDRNSNTHLLVEAPGGPAQNLVYLEFLGRLWQIGSASSAGGTWSGTVPVQDYVRWGVGLYKLVWESRDPEGKLVCKASTSIRIPGSPLGSVTGVAGLASLAVGLGGLTLALKTTINEGARWAIKAVAKGKADKKDRRLRLRPTFSLSQTLLGTLWGLLLSGGTLATLQETALTLPTFELALQLTIPFTLLSLVAGSLRLVRE